MEWIVAEFKKEQGIDLSKDRMAIQRLKEAAEKAKIELSQLMETEINLPFVTADASGPKHLALKLTRAKLEQLMEDLLQRTVGPVKQALSDAGITPDKIDEVVLVGGSTRIPRVVDIVKGLFNGKEPHKGVNPDEVVAVGAAIQGGVLGGEVKDILLLDVTPAFTGRRNPRRRDDRADPAQHHDSDAQVGDVFHRGGQSNVGRNSRAARRTSGRQRQSFAREIPSDRNSTRAARYARRSKSPSTSTPTAS